MNQKTRTGETQGVQFSPDQVGTGSVLGMRPGRFVSRTIDFNKINNKRFVYNILSEYETSRPMNNRGNFIYFLYSKYGECLYVGMTINLEKRLYHHSITKPSHSSFYIEFPPNYSRYTVSLLERLFIQRMKPVLNKHHLRINKYYAREIKNKLASLDFFYKNTGRNIYE